MISFKLVPALAGALLISACASKNSDVNQRAPATAGANSINTIAPIVNRTVRVSIKASTVGGPLLSFYQQGVRDITLICDTASIVGTDVSCTAFVVDPVTVGNGL